MPPNRDETEFAIGTHQVSTVNLVALLDECWQNRQPVDLIRLGTDALGVDEERWRALWQEFQQLTINLIILHNSLAVSQDPLPSMRVLNIELYSGDAKGFVVLSGFDTQGEERQLFDDG